MRKKDIFKFICKSGLDEHERQFYWFGLEWIPKLFKYNEMYSSLEVCQSNKYSEFFETHAKQCFNSKFQKRDSLFDWHVYSSLVKIRRKNQNKNCIFVSFCKNSQVLKIHFACDYRSLIKNKKKMDRSKLVWYPLEIETKKRNMHLSNSIRIGILMAFRLI